MIATRESENFQLRIKNLQEAENYRNIRYEKERNEIKQNSLELNDLKIKVVTVERERDLLKDRVSILQNDIERGAQRETRLTESLAGVAGFNVQNQQHNGILVPHQLLTKLKEMNEHLSENVRENRQLSETLQFLTNERQELQKRVGELEVHVLDRDELEEKANHLFGKYLRTESFRRALVHQKRYLMIVLSTYETNEAKVINLVNNNQILPKRRQLPSFKSVVLVAIAVERMKFILKRWQTGKRICAKAIAYNTPPRRTHSASTVNWTRYETPQIIRNTILKGRSTNAD